MADWMAPQRPSLLSSSLRLLDKKKVLHVARSLSRSDGQIDGGKRVSGEPRKTGAGGKHRVTPPPPSHRRHRSSSSSSSSEGKQMKWEGGGTARSAPTPSYSSPPRRALCLYRFQPPSYRVEGGIEEERGGKRRKEEEGPKSHKNAERPRARPPASIAPSLWRWTEGGRRPPGPPPPFLLPIDAVI